MKEDPKRRTTNINLAEYLETLMALQSKLKGGTTIGTTMMMKIETGEHGRSLWNNRK